MKIVEKQRKYIRLEFRSESPMTNESEVKTLRIEKSTVKNIVDAINERVSLGVMDKKNPVRLFPDGRTVKSKIRLYEISNNKYESTKGLTFYGWSASKMLKEIKSEILKRQEENET